MHLFHVEGCGLQTISDSFWCLRSHTAPQIFTYFGVPGKCHQRRHYSKHITLFLPHRLRTDNIQSTIICPFRSRSGPMFEEAGSFHKCTYTQVSKPPNPSVLPVINSTNAHSAHSFSLCGYVASSGLCWCCRVSSDNLQTLHSLNNSHYTCFQPDVKQKPFLEVMPDLKCKSRKFPSAGGFQGVIDYSLVF